MARKNLQVFLYVQEAREIGVGYKLYYHGEDGTKNGAGIVLCEDLKDRVLAVARRCDRMEKTRERRAAGRTRIICWKLKAEGKRKRNSGEIKWKHK